MAAAVQTNLYVAFTHGAQLTMGHCGPNPRCSHPLVRLAEPNRPWRLFLSTLGPASLPFLVHSEGSWWRRTALGLLRCSSHVVCFHPGNPGSWRSGVWVLNVMMELLRIRLPPCEKKNALLIFKYDTFEHFWLLHMNWFMVFRSTEHAGLIFYL